MSDKQYASTVADLDALPVGSTLLEPGLWGTQGYSWQKWGGGWVQSGLAAAYSSSYIETLGPFEVTSLGGLS